jgi:hypothetical protein
VLGVGCAAVGRGDQGIRRQEGCGDADGAVQQAARIVAQIKHQTLQRAGFEELAQMFDHRGTRILLEGGDAEIAVAVLDEFRLDALHLDDFARQRDVQRLGLALAEDRQLDLRLRLAAHALDGFGQGQSFDQRVVDLENQVARLYAGTVGRRVLDRRHHLDQAVFHADFDTDAAELALRADLQVLERVGIEVARVRVQVGEHAADGVRDQLLVVDRFDVAGLDGIEHLGEGAQFLHRQTGARFLVGDRRKLQADQNATKNSGAKQPGLFQLTHLSHSVRTSFGLNPSQRVKRLPLVAKLKV